jgi:hypothetical protein
MATPGLSETTSGLSVGDKVEARYRGQAEWYTGSICAGNTDGTFDVAYEDGDSEAGVHGHLIRRVLSKPTPSKPTPTPDFHLNPEEIPIANWLLLINPALKQYADSFQEYGYDNSGLVLVAEDSELCEAFKTLKWKAPHRRMLLKRVQEEREKLKEAKEKRPTLITLCEAQTSERTSKAPEEFAIGFIDVKPGQLLAHVRERLDSGGLQGLPPCYQFSYCGGPCTLEQERSVTVAECAQGQRKLALIPTVANALSVQAFIFDSDPVENQRLQELGARLHLRPRSTSFFEMLSAAECMVKYVACHGSTDLASLGQVSFRHTPGEGSEIKAQPQLLSRYCPTALMVDALSSPTNQQPQHCVLSILNFCKSFATGEHIVEHTGSKCSQYRQCSRSIHCLTCSDLLLSRWTCTWIYPHYHRCCGTCTE